MSKRQRGDVRYGSADETAHSTSYCCQRTLGLFPASYPSKPAIFIYELYTVHSTNTSQVMFRSAIFAVTWIEN